MKNKKMFFLCYIIFFVIIILLNRYKLLQLYHNKLDKDIVALNMTEAEKIEDFEYFYTTVISSMLILDEITNTYKIDFINNIADSKSNDVILNDYKNILTRKYKSLDHNKNKTGSDTRYYKGNGTFEDRNIYYLIGKDTGSAADCYISDIKNNTDSTIIGDNTGGEGLEDSFVAQSMPNSGLIFIYMPGKAVNPDGTDNSKHGTAPDVYLGESLESYYYSAEIERSKSNDLTEEEELRLDNVLYKTVQLINQKKFRN